MNILLVDDDIDIIEGIISGVNFDAVGITEIHTALSSAAAREVLFNNKIDIMLTDIEMPGESGLDLLAWVNTLGYDIVTLFCTSYADFNYAKKAVEMHSFDYFLKPISYSSLQNRLSAAVNQVKKNRGFKDYEKQNERWLIFQNETRLHFWTNVVLGTTSFQQLLFQNRESSISYNANDLICISYLKLYDLNAEIESWKSYGFRNIAEEILPASNLLPEAMIPTEEGSWMLIFIQNENFSIDRLLTLLGNLTACANNYLESELNCFFSADIACRDARTKYKGIKQDITADVCSRNEIINLNHIKRAYIEYKPKQFQQWEMLLLAGKGEELLENIEKHLDTLAEKKIIDRKFLMAMRMDIAQMIYSLLNEKGINVPDLLFTPEYETLISLSLTSLICFKHFLRYEILLAASQVKFAQQSESVIDRVKKYIDSHLGDEINRSTIAQRVYLNPDYLARLFKKETGQSIGAYLQDKRINKAKKMLIQTTTQVNEIALDVGYDNFSYFSHVFREKTGMTPNEYRKEFS